MLQLPLVGQNRPDVESSMFKRLFLRPLWSDILEVLDPVFSPA
jgi:hypothetical protein